MNEWLVRWAEALDERPITNEEIGEMLSLSRDVAHQVERKMAPLSSYLAGIHVGRRVAEGANAHDALEEIRVAWGVLRTE